jgi:hypothetical protein
MLIKKYITILLLMLIGIIFINNKVTGQTDRKSKSYPIPPNAFIDKFVKDNGIDLEKLASQPVLKKTSSFGFTVGSSHSWYSLDESSSSAKTYTVLSHCRSVGKHCYVFVEDAVWLNGKTTQVTQAAVDSVENAWDYQTPANANKGIYQTDVETFGNPPNRDGDSLIVILILDIKDGYTGTGGYVAGYFYPGFETSLNNAEILFIDANPQNLSTSSGLQQAMSTTAHEFQHMIEYNYGSQQDFFNEGCSVIAEYINGYPLYDQSYFNSEINHSLLNWRRNDNINVLYDYSRAARFFLYLKEQFYDNNKKFFYNFVTSGVTTGTAGLDKALSNISSARRFSNIVPDWFTANYLNDTTVNSKWGYKYSNLPKVASNIQLLPNIQLTTDKVYALSAQYVTFINGQNLTTNFSGITNSNVFVRELIMSPGPKGTVDGSTVNNAFPIPNAGTGSALNNNVTFMIYDAVSVDSTVHSNYSYMATGVTGNRPYQLMYDQTEPAAAQYGTVTGGDSVAVVFDGINITGAKLDSIRVALRQAGSLSGNVYRYSGLSSPTPIGKKLTPNPITATSTIFPRPPSNYPVPWNNWVKVDLTSLNIDATSSFVVSFGMNGDYTGTNSGDNRIMITEMPGTTAFHSYEKLRTPRNGLSSNQWHDATDISNNVVLVYLIRAYVSFPGTSGVQQVAELTPSSYKLEQNYPNPFNPTTTINYSVAKAGFVKIKVYDVLGREAATLINENKPAGNYTVQFNASKLVSGVYFYRIETDNFVQTKKMILMK